jgi:hypothetical protein
MNKMFTDNGFISEEGKKVLQPLHDGLMEVVRAPEVQAMSVQELRTLQANLAKLIGEVMSGEIFIRNKQGK